MQTAVYVGMGIYILIMAALIVVMGTIVNVVNTYRDLKVYRRRCEMLHDKLDRVTQERMDAEAAVKAMEALLHEAYAAVQRQRTASEWVRGCESDDANAELRKQEIINETIKRAKRTGKKENKDA